MITNQLIHYLVGVINHALDILLALQDYPVATTVDMKMEHAMAILAPQIKRFQLVVALPATACLCYFRCQLMDAIVAA